MTNPQTITYLACPFTGDQIMQETRQAAVDQIAGTLIHEGHIVFSPLTYSNVLKAQGLDFFDPQQWYEFDMQIMNICDQVIVVQLPGWDSSSGIALETAHAQHRSIPVYYNVPGRILPDHNVHPRADTPARTKPLVYLAAPYSHTDEQQIQRRVDLATRHAIKSIAGGEIVFSPISYTQIIQLNGFQAPPHSNWYQFDLAFLKRSSELRVLQLPGWRESHGVNIEIQAAESLRIPVTYADP